MGVNKGNEQVMLYVPPLVSLIPQTRYPIMHKLHDENRTEEFHAKTINESWYADSPLQYIWKHVLHTLVLKYPIQKS
jgi:hypothetical protein